MIDCSCLPEDVDDAVAVVSDGDGDDANDGADYSDDRIDDVLMIMLIDACGLSC